MAPKRKIHTVSNDAKANKKMNIIKPEESLRAEDITEKNSIGKKITGDLDGEKKNSNVKSDFSTSKILDETQKINKMQHLNPELNKLLKRKSILGNQGS